MTILITGAGGQLGRDLLASAGPGAIGMTRAELDVTDRRATEDAVGSIRPAVIVNCASWTDVDGCEEEPELAELVNATAVGWLAEACSRVSATLVQLSTDYVFSGTAAPVDGNGRPRGWRETDHLAPVNVYGRTKAAGEALVRDRLERHHIVRTAWLSGVHGTGFVAQMLRLGRDRTHLDVVDDQIGSPTYTRDLAAAITALLANEVYGTVHLANAGWCSRYEQARVVMELAGLDVAVRAVPSSTFPRPAPRPHWSALDGSKAAELGIELPHWKDGMGRLLMELGERDG